MTRSHSKDGVLASVRGLLSTVITVLRTRLELLGIELEEEKLRIVSILTYAVAAFFFLGFGCVLLVAFLTVLFWETDRLTILSVSTILFFGIGIASAIAVVNRARSGSKLFAASLHELSKDIGSLSNQEHE